MNRIWVFIRWKLKRKIENFWMGIAWKLPKILIMWCAIRVIANATQGEYSNQNVPDLTAMESIKRW